MAIPSKMRKAAGKNHGVRRVSEENIECQDVVLLIKMQGRWSDDEKKVKLQPDDDEEDNYQSSRYFKRVRDYRLVNSKKMF